MQTSACIPDDTASNAITKLLMLGCDEGVLCASPAAPSLALTRLPARLIPWVYAAHPANPCFLHRTVPIAPLLDHPLVEYLGEITDAEKCDLLGNAAAVLCTYDWPEPFGIVLIEALACGTPVLAYRCGSIPEIIEDGITGFVCANLEEMVAAIQRLPLIQRQRCRDAFTTRFTVERMVHDYLSVYERMTETVRPVVHLNGRSSRLHHRNPSATELTLPRIGTACRGAKRPE